MKSRFKIIRYNACTYVYLATLFCRSLLYEVPSFFVIGRVRGWGVLERFYLDDTAMFAGIQYPPAWRYSQLCINKIFQKSVCFTHRKCVRTVVGGGGEVLELNFKILLFIF